MREEEISDQLENVLLFKARLSSTHARGTRRNNSNKHSNKHSKNSKKTTRRATSAIRRIFVFAVKLVLAMFLN